jgi:hypothetical protein
VSTERLSTAEIAKSAEEELDSFSVLCVLCGWWELSDEMFALGIPGSAV